jgi:hypothetical protein
MNKNKLWETLCDRYPSFKDEEYIVKQTSRGLKRLVEVAWDMGFDAGFANGQAAKPSPSSTPPNPFPDIFNAFKK